MKSRHTPRRPSGALPRPSRRAALLAATLGALSCMLATAPASIAHAAGPLTVLTVRIGFAAPLSGDYADYGRDLQKGAQFAIDDANAQGVKIGDQTAHFELVSFDDRADPRGGVQAATRLANENVAAVVGHFNSGAAIAASRIYESAGIPMIAPIATNPTLTSQGFANTFVVVANDAWTAGVAGAWAVNEIKARRIAIVDDRSAFGQGEADVFERTVKARGGIVVARDFTTGASGGTGDSVDFGPQLARIQAANADLLYFGGLAHEAAALVRQMKARSMSAQFVGGGGVALPDFVRLAGVAGEGALAWEYGRPLAQLPDGPHFAQRFKSRFGVDVLAYAPFGYDAAWAAIHAMAAARSANPEVWRGALKTLSFDGVTGRIAFDDQGALRNGAATLYRLKQGAWVPVTTRGG